MSDISIGKFKFNIRLKELADEHGRLVSLRVQSLAVLSYLADNANRTVLKEELWQAIWPNVAVTDDSLVQCIKEIRRALGDAQREMVRTEYKRGYRLVVDNIESAFDERDKNFVQSISETFSSDGTRLGYASAGTGSPVIRAPHWMTHLHLDWQDGIGADKIRKLADEFQLVRFDGRGTGMSQRNIDPGNLDDWVDDLAAVADAAKLEKFALLGSSGGGCISLRYAVRFPDRVSCIVLLGANIRGGAFRGVSEENIRSLCKIIEEGWGKSTHAFQSLLTNMLWPSASPEMLAAFNRLQLASCDGATAAKLLWAIQNTTVEEDLPLVSVPTLVMHSLGDPAVPFEESQLALDRIPYSTLLTLNTNDHTPLTDDPEYERHLNETMKFIRKHAKTS